MMAAFISSPAAVSSIKALTAPRSLSSIAPTLLPKCADCSSSSVSMAAAPAVMVDFSAEALGFFNGVRIPSALIAGSSLGAVFSLVSLANKKQRELPTVDVVLLRLYHVFAMASLVLSLNVVVMSTVASTTLLLDHHDTLAHSAYQFLNREMRYEFVITRWSFLMSILCFLVGITNRALVEFNLLKQPRRRYGFCLILLMTSLLTHLVSFINETLYCWGSLTSMTITVVKLIAHRAMKQQKPLEIVSLVSFVGSVLCMPWLVHGLVWTRTPHGEHSNKSSLQNEDYDDIDVGVASSTEFEPSSGETVDGADS